MPLGYELFRELIQFAVQAYIGRDLVALCDLLFWPEKPINNFYENREQWNELCGVEMMNFETDLYLAREQGIQFETTGGRLKYLDIQITDDFDPQNLLRRIFSNELTPSQGRRLLSQTAAIKNYCGFVAYTKSCPASDGERLASDVRESSESDDQRRGHHEIDDTLSKSKKPSQASNEGGVAGNIADCNPRYQVSWNDILSNNIKGSLARHSYSDQSKDRMCNLTENTGERVVKNSDLYLKGNNLFDNSAPNELETTAPYVSGWENLQSCRRIKVNGHSNSDIGRSDHERRSYLGHERASIDNEVQKSTMIHFCSSCGRECFSTLKLSSNVNAELVSAQGARQVLSMKEKRSTDNCATTETTTEDSIGNSDNDSLPSNENISNDAFESCEEGSDCDNTDSQLTCHSADEITTSKNSYGYVDETAIGGDEVSDNRNDENDFNKFQDGHIKRESSSTGSFAKFVLNRLHGFSSTEVSKLGEKRKTRTVTSNKEDNKIVTEDCYKLSKQPRRDDTDSESESTDGKEV